MKSIHLAAMTLLTACTFGRDPSDVPRYDQGRPGMEAWAEDDISCGSDVECMVGESCIEQICQPQRCKAESYDVLPPIGEYFTFFGENEIAVADSSQYDRSYWVDGYGLGASTMSYDYSWEAGGEPITDIAGGDFHGDGNERYAAVFEGRQQVGVLGSDGPTYLTLGFVPLAVSGLDSNADGIDEVAAVGNEGIAVCDFTTENCQTWSFGGTVEVLDAAGGDVDGDAFEEVVVLGDFDGHLSIFVLNPDSELSGDRESYVQRVDGAEVPSRIDVADLEGDMIAEIIGLYDGGYWGFGIDKLLVYSVTPQNSEGGTITLAFSEDLDLSGSDYVDLAAGDTDLDDTAEVMLLNEEGQVTGLRYEGYMFDERFTITAGTSSSPHRIAMADHDGDTPAAKLVGGPEIVPGAIVPIALLMVPPYDAQYSDGKAGSFYGSSDSTSVSEEESISFKLNTDVGYGASLFDMFGGEVGGRLNSGASTTYGTSKSIFVGGRYTLMAEPEIYGPDYGAVVLTWGCFSGYVYEVDDPANHLGNHEHGEQFAMTVPVEGSYGIWSTQRYNALARNVGGLPELTVPHTMGDLSTYYRAPKDLQGDDIDPAKLLFPTDMSWTASDVSDIRFWLAAFDNEYTIWNMYVSLGAWANVKVGGIKVGHGREAGWGEGYSIGVGKRTGFAGSVPRIPDNPDTPEDEYTAHVYSITPYVYLHEWGDGDEPAHFYVMDYVVHDH